MPKKKKEHSDIFILEIREFFDKAMIEQFGSCKPKRRNKNLYFKYPYMETMYYYLNKEMEDAKKEKISSTFLNSLLGKSDEDI